MSSLRENRIPWLSFGRVAGILLVVFGHSYPFDVYIPYGVSQLREFIYGFHMPLFLFISGYLAAKSRRTPARYIAARARKLLIPYLTLSLAAFVPKMLVQQYLNDSVEFSFRYLLRTEFVPRENVWGHFWYIPVVFFLGVISAFAGSALREKRWLRWSAVAVAYGFLWLPEITDWFALEDLRKNLFFYLLGYALSAGQAGEAFFRNRLWLSAFPCALLLFSLEQTEALFAVLMIGFVMHLGTCMDIGKYPVLTQIEQNSYTIFLLSWPAQAVAEVVLNRIAHLQVGITMAGMFAAGMLVPLVCVKIVNWLEKYVPVGWVKTALGM